MMECARLSRSGFEAVQGAPVEAGPISLAGRRGPRPFSRRCAAIGAFGIQDRIVERGTRLELATACLEGRSSTTELPPQRVAPAHKQQSRSRTAPTLYRANPRPSNTPRLVTAEPQSTHRFIANHTSHLRAPPRPLRLRGSQIRSQLTETAGEGAGRCARRDAQKCAPRPPRAGRASPGSTPDRPP
jgi:hypothetical protein